MLLDRSARSTVRNFSTLFLVCMVAMLPLEMTYAFIHRSEIEVRELHRYIEDLPQGQKVRRVGPDDLAAARRDRAIFTGVELLLLPLLLAATRRVLEVDRREGVPTATDAWRRIASTGLGPTPRRGTLGPVIVAVAFALTVGFAAYLSGRNVVEVFPDRFAFVILGVVEATARSIGLPWLLVTVAEAGQGKPARFSPGGPGTSPPRRPA